MSTDVFGMAHEWASDRGLKSLVTISTSRGDPWVRVKINKNHDAKVILKDNERDKEEFFASLDWFYEKHGNMENWYSLRKQQSESGK